MAPKIYRTLAESPSMIQHSVELFLAADRKESMAPLFVLMWLMFEADAGSVGEL